MADTSSWPEAHHLRITQLLGWIRSTVTFPGTGLHQPGLSWISCLLDAHTGRAEHTEFCQECP